MNSFLAIDLAQLHRADLDAEARRRSRWPVERSRMKSRLAAVVGRIAATRGIRHPQPRTIGS
jgi:hypothetical protein